MPCETTLFDVATEGFDDLPSQRDDVGTPVGNETVFEVLDDAEAIVATASGTLAAATGVALEQDDPYWFIESKAGLLTSTSLPLARGVLPGHGATAGPFAEFFATPQDLRDLYVFARLRARPLLTTTAPGAAGGEPCDALARLLVCDDQGNVFATEVVGLGEEFEAFTTAIEDFTEGLNGATSIDFAAIKQIGLELLSSCLAPPETEFGADDIAVVPEPRLLAAVALASLTWLRRSRRRSRLPT